MMVRRAIPFFVFAILAAILLWPLATGKVLLPACMLGQMQPWDSAADSGAREVQWNALTWDGIAYFYPARYLLGKALRSGELPMWNPHQMCGMPFLASPQSAVLYPPNWLFAVLPVDLTFGLLAFLHLFAAASFTYLFLRKLGLGMPASTFGGTAFMLSGWAVVWLHLPVFLASGIWLPLTLYLCTVAWERRSAAHATLGGATIAISLFGGHPQIWLYLGMSVGAYCVFLAFIHRSRTSVPYSVVLLLLMFGVGFLLAAPQLLPTMELASLSHRGGTVPTAEGYRAYNALALPLRNLIGMFIPDFYGNPTKGDFWGVGEYAEFAGYVGLLPLLLAPFAFVGRGRRNAVFFAAMVGISLLMATGTGINALFYFGIPGFSRSGSPARVLYLYTFALTVLGAIGLDRLLCLAGQRCVRVLLGAIGVLVPVGIGLFHINAAYVSQMADVSAIDLLSSVYAPVITALAFLIIGIVVIAITASGRVRPHVAGGILTGMLALDLLLAGSGYNLFSSRDTVYPAADALQKLAELAGDQRIMPMNDQWRLRGFPNAVLPPNAATVYGLMDIQGYDSLYPVRFKRLLDAAAGRDSSPPENGNIVFARSLPPSVLDLLGVRYLLSPKESDNALELSGGLCAYENESPLPRAFCVHQARRTTDRESLELIARGGVNLRSVALVYESTPFVRGHYPVSSGAALVRSHTYNTVTVQFDNPDAPGLLILTDQFYPGWTARVDGKRTHLMRADYCFRAVSIPRGRHTVVFAFEPRSFRLGLGLAAAGLVLLIGIAVSSDMRSRGGRL